MVINGARREKDRGIRLDIIIFLFFLKWNWFVCAKSSLIVKTMNKHLNKGAVAEIKMSVLYTAILTMWTSTAILRVLCAA